MSANQFKINLCQHLKTAAINRPDSLAVALQLSKANKDAFKEMTFAELDLQSDQIAFALCQGGIKRGMKAVLMVKPGLEFFALTFGLFKAGIIPVMLDPGMGLSKLKTCINNVAADVFIGIPQAHFARRLLGWGRNSIKHLITVNGSGLWGGSSLDAMLAELNDDCQFDMALLNSDELCAILYTSGSTGSPKGVYYSHSMFEAQIQALKKDYGIAAGEVDLSTFPLFALFGPALGMASIVPDMDASKPIKADPARLLAAVEHYSCSNMFINPALLAKFVTYSADKTLIPLIRQQLSSVKRVISAGAPANVNHINAFSRLLPDGAQVLNSYGATEALPISMIASDELLLTREVTDNGGGICVGQALSGVEIRIIEIDERVRADIGDTENLSQSTIGEVMVRGAVVSPEYCDNPLATEKAKVLDGNRFWHRMGDLGYLDKQGRLWMCGRKGHRVCCDEKDYYSIPCERIFNTHAAVKRSALVGINLNNVPQPLICVELESGVSVNKAQLFDELKALAEQSPHTLGIRRFLLHPNFPVDVRHNAKIFREKLAFWAQKKWRGA